MSHKSTLTFKSKGWARKTIIFSLNLPNLCVYPPNEGRYTKEFCTSYVNINEEGNNNTSVFLQLKEYLDTNMFEIFSTGDITK